jgi:hypothetical protein
MGLGRVCHQRTARQHHQRVERFGAHRFGELSGKREDLCRGAAEQPGLLPAHLLGRAGQDGDGHVVLVEQPGAVGFSGSEHARRRGARPTRRQGNYGCDKSGDSQAIMRRWQHAKSPRWFTGRFNHYHRVHRGHRESAQVGGINALALCYSRKSFRSVRKLFVQNISNKRTQRPRRKDPVEIVLGGASGCRHKSARAVGGGPPLFFASFASFCS